ncbi:MAG: OadG family protein [Clostridiales bacterium]|nr:OadG family protein [Clostridiales bacterium]
MERKIKGRFKILPLIALLLVAMMLGACGTDAKDVDYNGYSYDDLEGQMYDYVSSVTSLASFYEDNDITEDTITSDVTSGLMDSYGFTQEEIDAGFKWMEIEEDLGEAQVMDMNTFKVTKSGNTLTTDVDIEFEERSVDFQVVYTYYSMEMSGITIEENYSLGERMQKAALNTLISIVIVFAVLIVISLIIWAFKIFPYIEQKRKAKEKPTEKQLAAAELAAKIAEPMPNAQQPADDLELVAVISAAIAASSGTPTGDFVVRSINRR